MIVVKENTYIMEDAREADRLASKVDADDFIKKYLKPYIQDQCRSILDIGCGPAVITSKLGIVYPAAQVTGIDISATRIAQAHEHVIPSNVHVLQASALDLPFADHSFDVVYCRFLLEYLRDKDIVFQEMFRVCNSGGRVILQDLDGQLVSNYPEPRWSAELKIIIDHLSQGGFDPYVGRKLFSLAVQAGFQVEEVKIEPYHLFAGRINPKDYSLWELKLDIALPEIAKALGTKEKANEFKSDYLEYLMDPSTFSYSTVFTVVGKKQVNE